MLSMKQTLYILLWFFHDKSGEYNLRSYLPKHEVEAIVHTFYPAIVTFFETKEGKHEFEEWKKKKTSSISKCNKITTD